MIYSQRLKPSTGHRLALPRVVQGVLFGLTLTLIAPIPPAYANHDDPYEDVNRGWDQFGSVYRRVIEHYYAPLNHDKIMRAAIEGMLRELDNYSQYYDEEGLRQLRQDTTGKFAGLGITVGLKDQYPVVIAPIEGTPAARTGIHSGDLIVAIEGRDTFGMSLEGIVDELRGEPGTAVHITLERRGVDTNWDVQIVREVIQIKSVAVADELVPGIGYISMRQTRFSEDTSTEVEESVEQLFAIGVTGLIVDLRGNPGGLLSQATEVADLFLPKGAPIVSVRERSGRNEQTTRSQRQPPAQRIPLVILIDGGSASAAEIVAGAIQDNDRGLVVGTTSFGKGSVQTIFDLREEEQSALKLTTALYYTPSGRSIHRKNLNTSPDPGTQITFDEVQLPAGQLLTLLLRAPTADAAQAQLIARFDLTTTQAEQVLKTSLARIVGGDASPADAASGDEAEVYHTNEGREVYGGGGITPDIIVEADVPPRSVLDLYRYRVFFDFVVEYSTNEQITEQTLEVDDELLLAFQDFIPRSAAASARQTQSLGEIKSLRALAERSAWSQEVTSQIDSLQATIERNADTITIGPEAKPYVRAGLRRELALHADGRRASLLVDLDTDPQVLRAVSLLQDQEQFQKRLHELAPKPH